MSRVKRTKKEKTEGNYFVEDKPIEFISTGSQLLDCVLGGGVAEGRVFNVVGDKSSGKTLMAIEVCANFNLKHGSSGRIWYHEAEAAFDEGYAAALGMPINDITFVAKDAEKKRGKKVKNDSDDDGDTKKKKKKERKVNTIEFFFETLEREVLPELERTGKPGIYILDSLDALSDEAELERDIDEGTYGMGKQKKLSELFRRLNSDANKAQLTVFIVSQIRDKIGAMFGEKKSRSGGKALDFYASQVLWLAEIKKLRKTFRGLKRVYGIDVKAQCKKNKVGLPFRDCEYPVLFGYGIDDTMACLTWLEKVKALKELGVKKADIKELAKEMIEEPDPEFIGEMRSLTKEVWREVEIGFLPKGRKY